MDCGCIVVITIGDPEIEFCPMHQTAGQMLEALKDFFAMMDEGVIVRSTVNDSKPDYSIRMMRFVMRLKKAQQAVALAEPTTPSIRAIAAAEPKTE